MSHNNELPYVLIVDDNPLNREILCDILDDGFNCLSVSDGNEALEIIKSNQYKFTIMLLDLFMPVMDGFELLEKMKHCRLLNDFPIIMISSDILPKNIERAFNLGVKDYITRPFVDSIVKEKILKVIEQFSRNRFIENKLYESVIEKEKNSTLLVSMLAQLFEYRNGESGSHIRHIGLLTRMLGENLIKRTDQYKLSDEDIDTISIASALHDIGKIAVPSEILNKPAKLTNEEYNIMKTHTTIGYSMIEAMEDYRDEKLFSYVRNIVHYHHERFDGRGFPEGLVGDDIPICAQLVALADVYDALTSKRCYKDAYSHEKSIAMILNNECGIFNPILMECLKDVEKDIKNRYESNVTSLHEAKIKDRIKNLFE